MNAADALPPDDPFFALLTACDDALAAGRSPEAIAPTDAPPELRERLERGVACLRRLRQCWPPAADVPRPTLGHFTIGRELGRGSFGVVFLARDARLGREVALKLPRAEALLTPEVRQRFLREARAAAGLDHPNLVPVYEADAVGPVCYIASAYCPGPTLAAWLRAHPGPVPCPLAASLVATLADAVDHAHARGVIHRDLKPGNVLLEETGATAPVPRVTDFGLARVLTESGEGQTRTGAILGTPEYMAPEQAAGRRAVGPAADTYALGVILYELLTGRPPFRGETVLETLEQVRSHDPLPPRRLRPEVPADLETICLTCLHKEPARRYPAVADLANDLRCFLSDRPIRARRTGRAERTWRAARRNPRLAGLAAFTALLLLVSAVGAGIASLTLRAARDDALTHLERARRAEADANNRLWQACLEQARAGRRGGHAGDRFRSLEALERAARLRPALELRNEAIACLALVGMRRGAPFGSWPEGTLCVACDPTGRHYVRSDGRGNLSLRRITDDREVVLWPGPGGNAFSCLFSPDGRFLAVAYHPGGRRFWVFDIRRNRVLLAFLDGHPGAAYSPDSRLLAIPRKDGSVRCYDLPSGRLVRRFQPGPGEHVLAFDPTGRALAVTCNEPPCVRICDAKTGQVRHTLPHAEGPRAVAWHPDGRMLATAAGFRVHVWDGNTGQPLKVLEGHQDVVSWVAFHPGGNLLASAGWDMRLQLWDYRTGRPLVSDHFTNGGQHAFSPDGRLLSCTRVGNRVARWELTIAEECHWLYDTPPIAGQGNRSLAFHPDGNLLASGSDDGVRLWNVRSARLVTCLRDKGHDSVLFLPCGDLIAGSSAALQRWPIRAAAGAGRVGSPRPFLQRPLAIGSPDIPCASADGTRVALADWGGGQVFLFNARDGTLCTILKDQFKAQFVALSPDGRRLAVGNYFAMPNNAVRVMDVPSGKVRWEYRTEHTRATFSPDGKWLVTGGEGCRIWDAASGRLDRLIPGDPDLGPVTRVAYRPDGRVLALAHQAPVVRLIEFATGRELARLTSDEGPLINELCYSPDGTMLACGCVQHRIQLWNLPVLRVHLARMGLDWDQPARPGRP